MEITGTYNLRATQDLVWSAMMDPGVLTQCIPACQVIEKTSAQSYNAQVKVKIGFIPVRFNVNLLLSNLDPPQRYCLEAQAEGGLAHAAKATGDVQFLQIDDQITRVNFVGQVLPGSKLFELGEPIVQKTASKWFNLFFQRFERVLLQGTDPL